MPLMYNTKPKKSPGHIETTNTSNLIQLAWSFDSVNTLLVCYFLIAHLFVLPVRFGWQSTYLYCVLFSLLQQREFIIYYLLFSFGLKRCNYWLRRIWKLWEFKGLVRISRFVFGKVRFLFSIIGFRIYFTKDVLIHVAQISSKVLSAEIYIYK